jgi:hypothetical protein
LFDPKDAYRTKGRGGRSSLTAGTNLPNGVITHFYLPEGMEKDSVVLNYHNAAGEVLASYSNKAKERSKKLPLDKGANTFVWDTRGTGAERLDGMILWWANLDGPKAVPGAYKVSMSVGDQTIATHDFSILARPARRSQRSRHAGAIRLYYQGEHDHKRRPRRHKKHPRRERQAVCPL